MVFLEKIFELDDFGKKDSAEAMQKKKKKTFIINQSANSYIEA